MKFRASVVILSYIITVINCWIHKNMG